MVIVIVDQRAGGWAYSGYNTSSGLVAGKKAVWDKVGHDLWFLSTCEDAQDMGTTALSQSIEN